MKLLRIIAFLLFTAGAVLALTVAGIHVGSMVVNPIVIAGDDGYDPVLGPPYPPVLYQLFRGQTNNGTLLTWTVPDVSGAVSIPDFAITSASLVGPDDNRQTLVAFTYTGHTNTDRLYYKVTQTNGVTITVGPSRFLGTTNFGFTGAAGTNIAIALRLSNGTFSPFTDWYSVSP